MVGLLAQPECTSQVAEEFSAPSRGDEVQKASGSSTRFRTASRILHPSSEHAVADVVLAAPVLAHVCSDSSKGDHQALAAETLPSEASEEQYRERAYFSQEMKVSKYELYREDIKDMTELTVSKMDVYMVINVLQLLFCVMLFTEGMPKPGKTPLWLHWILAASSASGVLYFVLSIWLGMHASIAAHSFGVRLLTQFVRLPVPNTQQIHRAAAKAKDYEALSLSDMLRIPVLQQQLRNLSATLGNLSQQTTAEDTTGLEDSFLPEVYMPSLEETASLKHIQLYRDLQANWQAYDAYSRVCMAMGTNQLLQSLNAYCLGVLLSETHSGWAAVCCMAVFSSVSWLIVRLDVLISWRLLMVALALQLGTPLLTLCCLAASILFTGVLSLIRALVPVIFVLHLAWMVCCLRLATGHGDKVSLPGKFRGVLYLDVFGWLSPEAESPRAPRRREAPAPTEQPPEDEAPSSFQPLPAMYMTLAELCMRQRAGLALQLEKWENPRVASVLNDESWLEEVAKQRRRFEEVEEELRTTLQRAREQPQQDADATPRVWLKLEWFASFQTL
ncbi:Dnah7, partial [Symbiodinium natans]